ncbi:MAG: hypothetical protein KUG61_05290 [Parvibaculaceae bacterium]|nr:hypothetical protein [Parvibaculaceae bacterium]
MSNNGINKETDQAGEIQIGPTDKGMVRLFVRGEDFELPMDFLPDEALEIAAELVEAAESITAAGKGRKK